MKGYFKNVNRNIIKKIICHNRRFLISFECHRAFVIVIRKIVETFVKCYREYFNAFLSFR